jgi:hypothetical protein
MRQFDLNISKIYKLLGALLFAFGLSGCGGGGGGGSTANSGGVVASTQSFPFKSAYTNLINSTATLPYTVTSGTQSGAGNLWQSALSNSIFQSVAVLAKTVTASTVMNVNGVSTPFPLTVTYYFDSNYLPVGSTEGADCIKVKGPVNIPSTVKVGDSGLMYSFSRFGSCISVFENRFGTVTYAVEPESATSVLVKLTEIQKDVVNQVAKSVSTTISVDVNGQAKRISEVSVDQYNVTTTLSYK